MNMEEEIKVETFVEYEWQGRPGLAINIIRFLNLDVCFKYQLNMKKQKQ